jgi:RND superfamily putative drug exporter
MSRTTHHTQRNLAARMGRWSADHWKTATFGWLAFVVAAFALGMAGTKTIDPNSAGPRESGRMDRILDAGFDRPAEESVLIQSRTLSAREPAFVAAVDDVVARLSKLDAVQNVSSGRISRDSRSALVEFEIRGPADEAAEKIAPVLAQIEAAQKAHPQLYVGEFGVASAVDAIATTVEEDLGKAGMLSLPITLVILVLAFGALVAAGIPLLLALTAVFATFGVVAGTSHVFPMANETGALVLLIGLAVGVDYSLFYLKREREERAAGRSERAALEAAAATSGRSVLVSGLTVVTAMAGMFLTGDPIFESFAIATIAVVAVAMIGSLTVLPALLSRLGDRVDRGRVPLVGRRRRDAGESRIWGAIVRGVLRRPLVSAVLASGLLVALALPALQLRMVKPDPETFPQSLPAVQTYKRMQQAFPGSALPANVVVKSADVQAPAMQAAIRQLRQQALATGRMHEPIRVEINADGTVANIAVPIDGTGTDSVSNASLAHLREEIVPATVGAVPGAEAGVTGATAQWKDSTDEMKSNLPLVVGFVLLLAFSLMLVAFRSPVIAVKAILLNLLSVAAAYGVLVLVFQHGYGSGLLGFTPTGGIDPVVPLLLFVILFGLSMDYHVFLLSRIREAVQRGASTEEAVARGITSTAGVVTSAAVVMVGVFAVFATLSMLMFKQFGVGLATAILIDATIVRAVLLPASMKLLGDWNWYLPRWLRGLPRFEAGESEIDVATPPRRRRARRLLPLGVVLATLLSVAVLSPVSLLAGTGNKHERPADVSQLGRTYGYGIGNFTLDLRDVELPQGTTRIEVELAVGHLLVKVPDGAALVIDGHAAAGKVDLLDETSDGTDVDDRLVVPGSSQSAPVLVLEADVGFGRLGVERG